MAAPRGCTWEHATDQAPTQQQPQWPACTLGPPCQSCLPDGGACIRSASSPRHHTCAIRACSGCRACLPSVLPSHDNLHLGAAMTCPPKTFVMALPGHPSASNHIEPHNETKSLRLAPLLARGCLRCVESHPLLNDQPCQQGSYEGTAFSSVPMALLQRARPVHVAFAQREATFKRLSGIKKI